jgi:hypothetical protein
MSAACQWAVAKGFAPLPASRKRSPTAYQVELMPLTGHGLGSGWGASEI